jgi:hypothetical protein
VTTAHLTRNPRESSRRKERSYGKDLQQATDAPVGVISRYKTGEKISSGGVINDTSWVGKTWGEFYANQQDGAYSGTVTLGDYIYAFSGPQSGCGNPDTKAGREANDTQSQRTKEFLSLFKNMRSLQAQE